MKISNKIYNNKDAVLLYLRDRAEESLNEIITTFGVNEFKERGAAINKSIVNTVANLKSIILQNAYSQNWEKEDLLKSILLITYCSYVVMFEFRNRVWPYEYMAFSRRVGELWEPFCKLCFEHPVKDGVKLHTPPLFSEVKKNLQGEIRAYISALSLNNAERQQLLSYYDKVWSLVTSGEIKLELDLHFHVDKINYNIDFKSGFQSNEKGNTNRLLLVASIYKNIINGNNQCQLFVRAEEEENNHYLQTLKNSKVWEVYCGQATYAKIREHSGFDLSSWISQHIEWPTDLSSETYTFFKDKDLVKYLTW